MASKKFKMGYNEEEFAAAKASAETIGYDKGYKHGYEQAEKLYHKATVEIPKPSPTERLNNAKKELFIAENLYNLAAEEQTLISTLTMNRERIIGIEKNPDMFAKQNMINKAGKVNVTI
jgi:hypothetical protein